MLRSTNIYIGNTDKITIPLWKSFGPILYKKIARISNLEINTRSYRDLIPTGLLIFSDLQMAYALVRNSCASKKPDSSCDIWRQKISRISKSAIENLFSLNIAITPIATPLYVSG
jgi:hypothetical protein